MKENGKKMENKKLPERIYKLDEDLSDYICKVTYKKDQGSILCKSTLVEGIVESYIGTPPLVKVIENIIRERGGKVEVFNKETRSLNPRKKKTD
ncbi:MAG: hypothetical protein HY929_07645 [Euryarchaeota archaeon]|nr:hypothetical protein [Euryarchaeota archaeon]